ncbi:TetR family transcriptional regulator [Pseudonocardia aurantiaca]|uniref:TetR family transcriptional regulator n=1 Tax=Pseudonocardia aurantiaca TaxID=75290 RepID=A0ABW4FQN1_9PSEU
MPRTAEARAPASPASKDQVVRRGRILAAAADLGARAGLEGVQMHEVAKDGGVAIGTLYRYFPSKTQLFATVFEEQIRRFVGDGWAGDGTDPTGDVGEMLVHLYRELTRRPRLGVAMVQSAAANHASVWAAEAELVQSTLGRAVLGTLGVAEPTERDVSVVRLLMYSWWGILKAGLTGKTTQAQAEAETRLAARLLLASCSASG